MEALLIDIKWIRENPDLLDASLRQRGGAPISSDLLKKDAERRASIHALQAYREKQNLVAESIAKARTSGEDFAPLIEQGAALKKEAEVLQQRVTKEEKDMKEALSWVPNVLADDVPMGTSEENNEEIRTWGSPRREPWLKDHMTLGNALEAIDMEQAAMVSGARFAFMMGDVVRLERALVMWFLHVHVEKFGYCEVSVPYLVREESMWASGQLPKFADDLFATKDGYFLIPTAEISLVNFVRKKKLSSSKGPVRLTAYTPCFRSEVGSAGRDVHGIMRMHQFHKVEMVSVCLPEESEAEHQRMVGQAEYLLQHLELPYRVMLLCSQDTGFCAAKTYDLEVWVPSEGRYREISSCSNCRDFQSLRADVKMETPSGSVVYPHMLNGSGLPTGRTLLAIMENYQQEDGSILIPHVLRPYMNQQEYIFCQKKERKSS